jgi:hypothetical protein
MRGAAAWCGFELKRPQGSTGRVLAAFAAIFLLAAACGEGSAEDDSAARSAADASVLTIGDMPEGWTQPPTDGEAGITAADLQLEGECAIFNEANASGFDGEVATAESPAFTGPDDQQVSSSATVFESPRSATAAVDTAVGVIDGCPDDIEDAARRLIEDAADAGEIEGLVTDIDVEFGSVEFPTYGNSTNAYRLQASVGALITLYEVTVDVVVLREGSIVGVLTYFTDEEPDESEVENLAETLGEKLATASATLAED